MKCISLFALLISISVFSQAGAPALPYYQNFNWNLTGTDLKKSLTTKITETHTRSLTYNDAEFALKIIDLDLADATKTNLILLYGFSSNTCNTSTSDDKDHRTRNKNYEDVGTNASCQWNREHTYPKALATPNLGTTGAGADIHHLRASDKKRNADRENDKFMDGKGNSYESGLFWYPGDEWKGDVARMMMYLYLRYDIQCLPINVGVGNPIENDPNMIDLFLKWNAEDPVSDFEDYRNTYSGNLSNTFAQGNRNPFIDNPYLATKIWGGPVAENRWPNTLHNTTFDTEKQLTLFYPNSNSNTVTIQTQLAITTIELIGLNGQQIALFNSISMTNDLYSFENLPNGTFILKIYTNNGVVFKKVSFKNK